MKQKAKKLLKQQEKIRLVKKRVEEFTCKRCKHSIKFDNNIKLHEHIRSRHAKKSKQFAQQSVELVVSSSISSVSESKLSTSSVSSSRSVIFSFFSSSKVLSLSMFTPEIVRERSESVSFISSVATPRKPIFWTEIASRSVVASKLSRFSIATPKSIYNILEKLAVCCSLISFTSFRTSTSSRPYLIVNDLFHMFAGKSSSFGLRRHQMRSFFSKVVGQCSFRSNCKSGPIQIRITSYFNAAISSASKTAKSEAFASAHVSVKHSARTSSSRISRFSSSMRFFFSAFSRSPSVCRHCQGRSAIYRPTGWAMPNASRVENNGIPMGMRYWRFASLHSALGEY